MPDSNSSPPRNPTESASATPSREETCALDRSVCEFESFEYYPDEDIHRAFYSGEESPPSAAVVSAVAAVSNTDPFDIEPLHSTVDPDALDALVAPRDTTGGDLHVTFEFHGYEVTASSYRCVKVRPTHRESASVTSE